MASLQEGPGALVQRRSSRQKSLLFFDWVVSCGLARLAAQGVSHLGPERAQEVEEGALVTCHALGQRCVPSYPGVLWLRCRCCAAAGGDGGRALDQEPVDNQKHR